MGVSSYILVDYRPSVWDTLRVFSVLCLLWWGYINKLWLPSVHLGGPNVPSSHPTQPVTSAESNQMMKHNDGLEVNLWILIMASSNCSICDFKTACCVCYTHWCLHTKENHIYVTRQSRVIPLICWLIDVDTYTWHGLFPQYTSPHQGCLTDTSSI